MAYLDATGEALAGLLRAGNAGSGTATDHIDVLDAALVQLPVDPAAREVICRTDAGGTGHQLAAACRTRHVRFIGGLQLKASLAAVVVAVPRSRWRPTVSADDSQWREAGEVAEITDLVELSGWPTGTRVHNCASPTSTGTAIRSSSPTCPKRTRPTWTRSTAAAAAWNAASATPKTPG